MAGFASSSASRGAAEGAAGAPLPWRLVAGPARVPIIGLGGVMDWRDAAELVVAGATAVGMGTALMVDPTTPRRVSQGLASWCARQGVASIGELVGSVRP